MQKKPTYALLEAQVQLLGAELQKHTPTVTAHKEIATLTERVAELEQTKKRLLNEVWHNRDKERARVKGLMEAMERASHMLGHARIRGDIPTGVVSQAHQLIADALAKYKSGELKRGEKE